MHGDPVSGELKDELWISSNRTVSKRYGRRAFKTYETDAVASRWSRQPRSLSRPACLLPCPAIDHLLFARITILEVTAFHSTCCHYHRSSLSHAQPTSYAQGSPCLARSSRMISFNLWRIEVTGPSEAAQMSCDTERARLACL